MLAKLMLVELIVLAQWFFIDGQREMQRVMLEALSKDFLLSYPQLAALCKKKDAVDGNSNSNSSNNNNNDAKYTAQYKKHTAPHKPGKYYKVLKMSQKGILGCNQWAGFFVKNNSKK